MAQEGAIETPASRREAKIREGQPELMPTNKELREILRQGLCLAAARRAAGDRFCKALEGKVWRFGGDLAASRSFGLEG